jgi:hypothetical protein
MCIECEVLRKQIVRYRALQEDGFDVFTVERIEELIEDLERRRKSLHGNRRSATSLIMTMAK